MGVARKCIHAEGARLHHDKMTAKWKAKGHSFYHPSALSFCQVLLSPPFAFPFQTPAHAAEGTPGTFCPRHIHDAARAAEPQSRLSFVAPCTLMPHLGVPSRDAKEPFCLSCVLGNVLRAPLVEDPNNNISEPPPYIEREL